MERESLPVTEEELVIEEADAWFEYLEVTRTCAGSERYDEVEPEAWAQLRKRLRVLRPSSEA